MVTLHQSWLVIYTRYNGEGMLPRTSKTAKVIVDRNYALPFGVTPAMIGDDCHEIIAISSVPDDFVPTVSDGYGEIQLQKIEEPA